MDGLGKGISYDLRLLGISGLKFAEGHVHLDPKELFLFDGAFARDVLSLISLQRAHISYIHFICLFVFLFIYVCIYYIHIVFATARICTI